MSKKVLFFTSTLATIALASTALGVYAYASHTESDSTINASKQYVLQNSAAIINLSDEETNNDLTYDDLDKINNTTENKSIGKSEIFHMMLNSVDNYEKVSGSMAFSSDNKDIINVVDFESDLLGSISYSRFRQCTLNNIEDVKSGIYGDTVFEEQVYCVDGKQISIYPMDKTYRCIDNAVITMRDATPIPDEQRIDVAEDGLPLYRFRNDPTNVLMSSMCLFPQDIAFGFLENQELWDIADLIEIDGIMCYHINGKTSEEYGKKLNVDTFDFYIDSDTGVLIRYEGFDSNGVLSDFMYTNDLCFNSSAKPVSKYSESITEDYDKIK